MAVAVVLLAPARGAAQADGPLALAGGRLLVSGFPAGTSFVEQPQLIFDDFAESYLLTDASRTTWITWASTTSFEERPCARPAKVPFVRTTVRKSGRTASAIVYQPASAAQIERLVDDEAVTIPGPPSSTGLRLRRMLVECRANGVVLAWSPTSTGAMQRLFADPTDGGRLQIVDWSPASNPVFLSATIRRPDQTELFLVASSDPRTADGFVALAAERTTVGSVPARVDGSAIEWIATPGLSIRLSSNGLPIAELSRTAAGLRFSGAATLDGSKPWFALPRS